MGPSPTVNGATDERRDLATRFARLVAGAGGIVFLAVGVWAFVSPRSFFEAVAVFEPYNAHFLRDIGAFQVGLGAVLLASLVWRDALLVALTGVGIGAVAHLTAHVLDRDLGGEPGIDLPFFTVIAVVLVVAAVARARSLRSNRTRDD